MKPTYQCSPYPVQCPSHFPDFPPLSKCFFLSPSISSFPMCTKLNIVVLKFSLNYFTLTGHYLIWDYVQWYVTEILPGSGLARIEICYSLASRHCHVLYCTECHFFPHSFSFPLWGCEEDSDYTEYDYIRVILRYECARSHICLIFHEPTPSSMVNLLREARKCCLIVG